MGDKYAKRLAINFWAEGDRPREKMLAQGRRSLSDAELIAILIGSGSKEESAVELSRRILAQSDNDLNKLAMLSIKDLTSGKFKGIGAAKAVSIIAALELGRRRKDSAYPERSQITSSKDVFQMMLPSYEDLNHEEFWVVLLNTANKVIGKHMLSKGGRAGTVVDVKILFEEVLSYKATSIILTHNHPSGNLKPSNEDRNLTKRIVEAGKLLDIKVLDHLIFANAGYYSFSDEGDL
ncbi:MAG TPA: DNA repair protein RadC [Sphingobacteriaceae bacterium]|nr:DNA repair protein RadC [Sphingobacteriaceae bacterium]